MPMCAVEKKRLLRWWLFNKQPSVDGGCGGSTVNVAKAGIYVDDVDCTAMLLTYYTYWVRWRQRASLLW